MFVVARTFFFCPRRVVLRRAEPCLRRFIIGCSSDLLRHTTPPLHLAPCFWQEAVQPYNCYLAPPTTSNGFLQAGRQAGRLAVWQLWVHACTSQQATTSSTVNSQSVTSTL